MSTPYRSARAWAILHDANSEALQRRTTMARRELSDHTVMSTGSTTAALLCARLAPPDSVAFIDLCDADRDFADPPGFAVIRRLAACTHVRPVAWTAHRAPHLLEGARRAGACATVIVEADEADEATALRAAVLPTTDESRSVTIATSNDERAPWASWFSTRYGVAWTADRGALITQLAAPDQRRTMAQALIDSGVANDEARALAALRTMAKALGGDGYRSHALVQREARNVLSMMALFRPLPYELPREESWTHAALALATEPSIAVAAAIDDLDRRVISASERHVSDARTRGATYAGAPLAGTHSIERYRAAVRVARELGAIDGDVETVANGLVRRVAEAAAATASAQIDAVFHPQARASAALIAWQEAGPTAAAPDGVAIDDHGVVTWNGLEPLALALSTGHTAAALHTLIRTIDEILARDVSGSDARVPLPPL